ncbi:hypothetical protein N7490_002713 [Penicillium lividum]|nr:hypothetical protein N7490_002713 [Penicillium lividum]
MPKTRGNENEASERTGRGKPKPLRRAGTSRAGTPRAGNPEDCPVIALGEEGLEKMFDGVVELNNSQIEEAERLASRLSSSDFAYRCDE